MSLFPSPDVVIGQAQAVHALTQAMKSDRLAHGLLFAGPAGVGKETCARGLARGLLCERRQQICENWDFLRDAMPQALDRQVEPLLGSRLGPRHRWPGR